MKIKKSTQLGLLICIFLIISITPVSASLQTELNPTCIEVVSSRFCEISADVQVLRV